MHRFFLPPNQCQGPTLFLTGGEAHHALHVLRVSRGQRVSVLDGAGHEFLCEVQEYNGDKVSLSVAKKNSLPPWSCRLTLLQAIPKGKVMETIVQKATELGASRVVPLLSERVVAQFDQKEAVRKARKWQQVAIEALKQCGSVWLPQIEAPLTPAQFLARNELFELPLVASLQSDSRSAREYFRAFQSERDRLPDSVCVWIGPEGDFTAAELAAIQSHGARPITLGRLVLRTDTAAVFCLSVVNHELYSVSDGR